MDTADCDDMATVVFAVMRQGRRWIGQKLQVL
jgi:hypothetical protein